MRILLVALIALAVGATVVDLTSKNLQNITQIKFKKCCPHHPNTLQKAWFIIFHETNCDSCKEASTMLQNVAEQYSTNETIRFGSVDCNREEKLCESAVIHGLPSFLLFTADGKAYRFEGHRDQPNLVNFVEGSYKGLTPLDFVQPSVIEQLVHAINSYGLAGTLMFAASVAMFLFACFSAIFKERTPTNIKQKPKVDVAAPISSAATSSDAPSPGRSKRD